jgi:hypothetical protein
MFKPRFAQRSLDRYRKKGLDRLERQMVESTLAGGLEGARVLEIGGGIGAIQVELLGAGAASGEVVELVSAYQPYATELARERRVEQRASFVVADILERPDSVQSAEIVVLNRVVCCSPEGVELAAAAARLTRHTLVLSYPRDVVWMRAAIAAMNTGFRILRRSFRTFVHRPDALAAAAETAGLVRTASGRGVVWEFAAFDRLS